MLFLVTYYHITEYLTRLFAVFFHYFDVVKAAVNLK